MSDIKKFLDYEGVKYLWSKINMNDYPNNEMLMAVIQAIDETKVDKIDDKGLSTNDFTNEYKEKLDGLENYATESYVNEGLATKQPVGDYALKSDIPTDYLKAVPAEYVTEYELNSKGYLTEQSLDGLATETFVTEQIAGKADIGHVHSWNELTDNPFTEENALNLVAEMRLIDPATNEDGVLLTDENNKIVII